MIAAIEVMFLVAVIALLPYLGKAIWSSTTRNGQLISWLAIAVAEIIDVPTQPAQHGTSKTRAFLPLGFGATSMVSASTTGS